MDTTVGNLLAPSVAVVIALATMVFTEFRSRRLEERAATKDMVDSLLALNGALSNDLADVRRRLGFLEDEHQECERERHVLLQQIGELRLQLKHVEDAN